MPFIHPSRLPSPCLDPPVPSRRAFVVALTACAAVAAATADAQAAGVRGGPVAVLLSRGGAGGKGGALRHGRGPPRLHLGRRQERHHEEGVAGLAAARRDAAPP